MDVGKQAGRRAGGWEGVAAENMGFVDGSRACSLPASFFAVVVGDKLFVLAVWLVLLLFLHLWKHILGHVLGVSACALYPTSLVWFGLFPVFLVGIEFARRPGRVRGIFVEHSAVFLRYSRFPAAGLFFKF